MLHGQKVADHDWNSRWYQDYQWLLCVGFNKKKCNNQIRKTSYAQHQQVRQTHEKMMEIMTWEVQTNDLKEVVNKLIPDSIGKDIKKACQFIYLLHDVLVSKNAEEAQIWIGKTHGATWWS